MKILLTIAALSSAALAYAADYPTSEPIKSIPLPPAGQRWVVNEHLSDEFNGTELDKTKWLDHHPTWRGREPGLFVPENISFKDGCMELHGEKMKKEVDVKGTKFNISCAAVVSKGKTAHYGYYECRFKASKSTLSSTFWLSSRQTFDTKTRQPEGAVPGKFSQELDICECIGRPGDFKGNFFSQGMNSNVHYWFTPKSGEKQDIRIKETRLKLENGELPRDDFNVYGCWWHDKSSATFYLNNGEGERREFVGRESWGKPYEINFNFTEPMGLHMVVETYPYPWIPIPTDEELADPTKNRTKYDWVRSYILVDAAEKNAGAAEMVMFKDLIHIAEKPKSVTPKSGKMPLSIHYTAGVDREITLILYDGKGRKVGSEKIAAPAGYANLELSSGIAKKAKSGDFTVVATLSPKGEEKSLCGDSVAISVK